MFDQKLTSNLHLINISIVDYKYIKVIDFNISIFLHYHYLKLAFIIFKCSVSLDTFKTP